MLPRNWQKTYSGERSSCSGESVWIKHAVIRLRARRLHEGRMAPVPPIVPVAVFCRRTLPVGLIQARRRSHPLTLAHAGHCSTSRHANHSTDGHHHHPEPPIGIQGSNKPGRRTGRDEPKEDYLSHDGQGFALQPTHRLAVCNPCHQRTTLISHFSTNIRSKEDAGHPTVPRRFFAVLLCLVAPSYSAIQGRGSHVSFYVRVLPPRSSSVHTAAVCRYVRGSALC